MNRRVFWGSLVILIGIILLLEAAGIVTGNIWRYFWAVLLVLIGIGILVPEK
ncbi:MAG: DUF5668 domain-containing protein [Candidatus Saganbacteria bacterium]|nr:DUF5668 domain-containing protein [Candidatus Saganbacteria bacterium]